MIRAAAVVLAVSVAFACSDADDDATPSTTVTSPTTVESTTTEPPAFTGDPDSPFCTTVRAAADRPLLDPFEAGLAPDEVELRLRALTVRFGQFAEQAPDELRTDLDDLSSALTDLESALADFGHDLGVAAEAGIDLSVVDDPRFVDVAVRLTAYTTQVCGAGDS